MDCRSANELLPGYVLDVLSTEEHAQVLQHLNTGCEQCQSELKELTVTASVLGESLDPVIPRPELKSALLDRIANEPQDAGSVAAPTTTLAVGPADERARRISFFPYIAATVAAVAAGSLVANFANAPLDSSSRTITIAATPQWQQSIVAAERAFGPPRAQLTSLSENSEVQKLKAAVFYDGLAQQLHVLVAESPLPSAGQQLWFWVLDENGTVIARAKLDSFDEQRSATVIDFSGSLQAIREIVITNEPNGDVTTPEGEVVGRARLGTQQ